MAAHGLTIMRQCRKQIADGQPTEAVTKYVQMGLFAPGTCISVGFDSGMWSKIDKVNDNITIGQATVADLLPVLDEAIERHLWMDVYPTMEAIAEAQSNYLRVGTPYWKTRSRRFDAGDARAHLVARASITDSYAIDRGAPVT